jgi:hypothetical protein
LRCFSGARLGLALCGTILCLLTFGAGSIFAGDGGLEAKVKSAYILYFTKFIEWPAADSGSGRTLKICLLGEDPIAERLRELSTREAKGQTLQVELHRQKTEALSSCHILFISRSEQDQLDAILQRFQGRNILTVSDIPHFTRHGGVIGFVTEDGKVQIEINLAAAREAGLKVSAKLMEVARAVQQ